MTNAIPLETVSDGQLRAWADSRVISSATYVEEMERRRGKRVEVLQSPPLDFDLDLDLDFDLGSLGRIPIIDAYDDETPEPFEARSMFNLVEGLLIAGTALIGVGLLAWGLWSW